MNLDRYRRQTLVKELGDKGQEMLLAKHVVIIGGGGLGSHSASLLMRMGIGSIEVIDDDVVDITNLHRTAVFSEQDIGKSKAIVLQEKLQKINAEATIRGINQRVTEDSITSFVKNADIVIDGTDNIPLRCLVNSTCLEHDIPWVYSGVYETVGMVMGIVPQQTPCFQCISQNLPEPPVREIPVLGSLPAIIAAIQANEAVKILLGKKPAGLLIYDVWNQCFETVDIKRNPHCPICSQNKRKE